MSRPDSHPGHVQRSLFAGDFDGTMFLTAEPAPGGIGVNEAYQLAISEVLDDEAAALFMAEGGHNHRDPTEIVSYLRPSLTGFELERAADSVTGHKLDILMDLIGRPMADGVLWPRPTEGFTELWRAIYAAKDVGRLIGTATISAGHTDFQKKTFSVYDLPHPDIFITADVMRQLSLSRPPQDVVKPSPILLRLAQAIWRDQLETLGIPWSENHFVTHYAGDDPIKDAQLAQNSGVSFELITNDSQAAWRRMGAKLHVPKSALIGVERE
jgi:hypothetical protein